MHSLLKFYSKQKIRLVLLFGSIYQHFTFLQIAICFTVQSRFAETQFAETLTLTLTLNPIP